MQVAASARIDGERLGCIRGRTVVDAAINRLVDRIVLGYLEVPEVRAVAERRIEVHCGIVAPFVDVVRHRRVTDLSDAAADRDIEKLRASRKRAAADDLNAVRDGNPLELRAPRKCANPDHFAEAVAREVHDTDVHAVLERVRPDVPDMLFNRNGA